MLSDRKPITERRDEIAEHDIADGPLKPPQWKDVKLVYLDPPYWKQAAGKYSTDKEDLANMDLVAFTKMMAKLIKAYALKVDGYIALIIGPTQYSAEDHKYTDHLLHLVSSVKLPVALRFSVPYESQQYGAVHVEWAKKENTVLVLTREVIVWKTKGKVDGVYV